MRERLRLLWRWSWIATLPATALLLSWGAATLEGYASLRLRHGSKDAALLAVGRMEFLEALEQIRASGSRAARARPAGLRELGLAVAESDLARLDSHLPQSGFEDVSGALWNEGRLRRAKVRYRGDSIYHWGNSKKSFRVKTKKGRLYLGMRSFNLIAPRSARILENQLSYALARRLGLIAPFSETVELRLNGRPDGIYALVEQPTELMLRRLGRMPGDLYVGEWINRDLYRGVSRRVFQHAGLWDKAAVDAHRDEDFRRPLEALLARVHSPHDPDAQRGLSGLVDLDAFGRFAALQVLTQATHADNLHNWRLYYDPWRARFEPVVWDFMGWSEFYVPPDGQPANPDILSSDLHLLLHLNGDFLRARHRAIRDFFETGADREFLAEVDAEIAAVAAALPRDPHLHQYVGKHIDGRDHVASALRELRASIARVFGEVREQYLEGGGGVAARALPGGALALSVTGRRPVERLRLRYRDAPPAGALSARLRSWHNGEPEEADVSGGLAVRGDALELDAGLLADFQPLLLAELPPGLGDNRALLRPARYELEVAGLGAHHELLELQADRGGGWESVAWAAALEAAGPGAVHGGVRPRPARRRAVWSGDVAVDGVQELDEDLVLRPGTTLRLGPGAGLVLRGRLLAEGTAEQPVRFVPARPDQQPWGSVALVGPRAAESQLAFCELSGGSGLRGDLFEYSAMLSIHDVPGVRIRDCAFRDGRVVDDMVHVVYGDVRFERCLFERAHADALDLDMTRAVVESSSFSGSGNDAIDLMTTEAVVVDTRLEGSGDKGISVGEGSRLLAIRDRLRGNAIGLQVRDGSTAVAHNVDLEANELALDAHRNNWQYGAGGTLFVYKARLRGNAESIASDAESWIRVFDSYLDRLPGAAERIFLDATVDSRDPTGPRRSGIFRAPEDTLRPDSWDAFWSRADPRRGAGGA